MSNSGNERGVGLVQIDHKKIQVEPTDQSSFNRKASAPGYFVRAREACLYCVNSTIVTELVTNREVCKSKQEEPSRSLIKSFMAIVNFSALQSMIL